MWVLLAISLCCAATLQGQTAVNDTIRLGTITEKGIAYPAAFLPEVTLIGHYMNPVDKVRRDRLRNDIFITYPYAITAATILHDVNSTVDSMDRRRDRKKYLKTIDKQLDATFKEPLKNLTIDQGHVLVKLINRQTGQNCYSIIREMKGGLSAVVWQSVGLFFNNNLHKEYDPEGKDKEMEGIVKDLEASNAYRYALYQQDAMLRKITKK